MLVVSCLCASKERSTSSRTETRFLRKAAAAKKDIMSQMETSNYNETSGTQILSSIYDKTERCEPSIAFHKNAAFEIVLRIVSSKLMTDEKRGLQGFRAHDRCRSCKTSTLERSC
jgi:hypothetical protein